MLVQILILLNIQMSVKTVCYWYLTNWMPYMDILQLVKLEFTCQSEWPSIQFKILECMAASLTAVTIDTGC